MLFRSELDVRCPGLAGADHCQPARSYSMAPKLQVRRLTPPSRSTRPTSQDLHAISKELPCLILLASQIPETFSATCDSIALQGISLRRIAVKRFARFLLLVSAPALIGSAQQASAMQAASQNSSSLTQAQAANQASSHDRHHRKHSSVRRHHHHHKASTQH